MNAKIVAAVAVACCWTLAGCETTGGWAPPSTTYNTYKCPKGQACDVSVTVADHGGVCKPQVVTFVDGKDLDNDATITWVLPEASPYKFSNERYKYGIFIKDDPRGAFSNVTNNGKRLSLKFAKNNATTNQHYQYAITVQRTGNDAFCETLDPWFIS